jgi:recombination protein RecA
VSRQLFEGTYARWLLHRILDATGLGAARGKQRTGLQTDAFEGLAVTQTAGAGTPGMPVYTSGGRALGYYASVRLELCPLGQLNEGGRVVGSRLRVQVTKNKVASAGQTAELEVHSDRGVLAEPSPQAATA